MELAYAQSLAVYRILAQQKRLATDQLYILSDCGQSAACLHRHSERPVKQPPH